LLAHIGIPARLDSSRRRFLSARSPHGALAQSGAAVPGYASAPSRLRARPGQASLRTASGRVCSASSQEPSRCPCPLRMRAAPTRLPRYSKHCINPP
jgi:hypothetical protein